MVYEAPLVAIMIGMIEVIRYIGLKVEKQWHEDGREFPVWAHWYSWYYVASFILVTYTITQSSLFGAVGESHLLDPITTEELANSTIVFDAAGRNGTEEEYRNWKEEASLNDYQLLRFFSMLSPIWLLGTFIVSVVHTRRHVRKVEQAGGLRHSPLRDSTLRILGLPLCYGMMSFKSVVRMWQVCVNAVDEGSDENPFFHSYESRKEFVMEMFESNFMVADIYEAYALFIFGKLLIEVLSQKLNVNDDVARTTPRTTTDIQRMSASLGRLTIAGIMLFFYTCLGQACYTLFVTTMGFLNIAEPLFSPDPEVDSLFQNEHVRESSRFFFLGAGFVASFAAIGNIMQVETTFHDALKNFHPAPKFWGTKILVTLAFIQSCGQRVIPPFSSWSEVRSNLLYSSCLCLECFLISLSHLYAWQYDEGWYGENSDAIGEEPMPDGVTLELQVEPDLHSTAVQPPHSPENTSLLESDPVGALVPSSASEVEKKDNL